MRQEQALGRTFANGNGAGVHKSMPSGSYYFQFFEQFLRGMRTENHHPRVALTPLRVGAGPANEIRGSL